MSDDDDELTRLLRQMTLRMAREAADAQAYPVRHMIRHGALPALVPILLGAGLTMGPILLAGLL